MLKTRRRSSPSELKNDPSAENQIENKNISQEIEIKEPELFEESNSEEDLEIPAFLRRQKN